MSHQVVYRPSTEIIEDHALVSCLYKSESRDSTFQKAQAKRRYSCVATWSIYVYFINGLELHGPSLYTLSMVVIMNMLNNGKFLGTA